MAPLLGRGDIQKAGAVPSPLQVQTSDEVGSGLRRLRGCPMLALERFKSIQKRGLIEPRKRAGMKGPKRVVRTPCGLLLHKLRLVPACPIRHPHGRASPPSAINVHVSFRDVHVLPVKWRAVVMF